MTRREFLQSGIKIGIGAALLYYFGGLFSSGRINTSPENLRCDRNGLCRGCTVVDECKLPGGLSFKKLSEKITGRRG